MERSKTDTNNRISILVLVSGRMELVFGFESQMTFFLTDDIHPYWHGVGCDFAKRQTGVRLKAWWSKNVFARRVKIQFDTFCSGKDGEFVFLVDDYRYTMTHSWGWILSVRDRVLRDTRPLDSTHIEGTSSEITRLSPRCPLCLGLLLALQWLRSGVDGFLVRFLDLAS